MKSPNVPLKVWWQYLLGLLLYIPLQWWVIAGVKLRGYRIKDRKKWRRFYKELTDQKLPPLVICPNHLTLVDSIVLIHAFGNHCWYGFNFRRHPWNLVAKEYSKNPIFNCVCYLAKCLYLDRQSEKTASYPTLNTAVNLLRLGEIILVFPEGRRSKTGRYDDSKLAYGVGKMIAEVGDCRVLCTYLRAPEQGEHPKSLPSTNANFEIHTELVHYKVQEMGENPVAKITEDISERIKKLEVQFFSNVQKVE